MEGPFALLVFTSLSFFYLIGWSLRCLPSWLACSSTLFPVLGHGRGTLVRLFTLFSALHSARSFDYYTGHVGMPPSHSFDSPGPLTHWARWYARFHSLGLSYTACSFILSGRTLGYSFDEYSDFKGALARSLPLSWSFLYGWFIYPTWTHVGMRPTTLIHLKISARVLQTQRAR